MADDFDDSLPYLPGVDSSPGRTPDEPELPIGLPSLPPVAPSPDQSAEGPEGPLTPAEMAVRNVPVTPPDLDLGLPKRSSVPDQSPSPASSSAPSLPPAPPSPSQATPPAPPSPHPAEGVGEQRLSALETAVRNVPVVRPTVDYGLPTAPPESASRSPSNQPDFVRPELEPMGHSTAALLIGRGLMVLAALLVGIAARRSAGAGGSDRADAFWPVSLSAGVFVVVGVAGFVFWNVELAENARRLKARAASPKNLGWAWAIPIGWVAVSSLSYLRIETSGDLNPLPGVAAVGFAVALAIPYVWLQGVFRGLSRQPPVLWISAFPLDLLAFGLIWWRLTSWPDPVTGSDWDHVRLTATISFGAAAALAVNGLVFAWLAQRGSAGVFERLGRLEARHRPADGEVRPEWFATGLQTTGAVAPIDTRPLVNTTVLSGVVALFHVLWGLSTVALGIALVRIAFDYDDRTPILGETLELDDADAERIAVVASTVAIVYVITIIVHGVWSVLVALNARRVTVHAPNPGTFAIIFTPMPVLVVAGLLIGGTVGYWVVLAGLGFAFFALLLVNRMLMALSARLGGALKGFSTWTLIITLVYAVGVAENFLFSEAASRLGFLATATFMQGVLIMIGGVFGFRAMQALEETLRTHRQTRRADPT